MNITNFTFFLLSFIFLSSCSSQEQLKDVSSNDSKAIVIGKKINFFSKVLSEEKELHISLPPKYEQHVQSYPLIITFEAEYLFDATRSISNYMAARSKMPESIVISIANKEFEKRHDANYERWNGKPDLYIKFFEEELIPYLEENYRIANHRTIIGLSPSTGFLFETFQKRPELFNAYIALSAHLEWDRVSGTSLFEEVIAQNDVLSFPKTSFYMGRAESDFSIFKGSKEAFEKAQNILKTYTSNQVKIKLDVLEEDEHYLMVLRGIRSGLELIYPPQLWKNPGISGWDKEASYASELFEDYYAELSTQYGFDIYPVENAHAYGYSISGITHSSLKWGTQKQIKELATLGSKYFPNSVYFQTILAELYSKEGETMKAKEAAFKAIELTKKFNSESTNEVEEKLSYIVN